MFDNQSTKRVFYGCILTDAWSALFVASEDSIEGNLWIKIIVELINEAKASKSEL